MMMLAPNDADQVSPSTSPQNRSPAIYGQPAGGGGGIEHQGAGGELMQPDGQYGGQPDAGELQLQAQPPHQQHHQQQQQVPQQQSPGSHLVEQPEVNQQATGAQSQVLQTRADLPSVRALNVKCEKNHMTVNIVFDRPFYGLVFSKGHYNDQKCVHLPANSGQTSVNFDIHLGKCGMTSSDAHLGAANGLSASALQSSGQQQQQPQQPHGLFIENTIIIQYDPQVQEIYDQARKLRCTWYDYYEKSVTFRPYNVDMLDAVTANFLGDNIQCWMQIQVGKGPWSSEVTGIVKIGQTMTMVLAIKDDENRFDMLVRNCVAHDGKHQPIQLVDEYGCVARPKIMGKFQKVRNFGPAATVVSYAHFQAFKFPDSMSVHFQCVIQVCRYECPELVCPNNTPAGIGAGNSPGELAGSGGPSGGADYAVSGTELVASKEMLPSMMSAQAHHNQLHSHHQQHHVAAPYSGANTTRQHQQQHQQQPPIKLDESQGRVQVKLDTSMMADMENGPGRQRVVAVALAPTNGMAQPNGNGAAARHTFLSSSYPSSSGPYARPAPGGAPRASSHSGRLQLAPASQLLHSATLSPAAPLMQQLAPPVAPTVHYSPPYPSSSSQFKRAASSHLTSRLGELPAGQPADTSSEMASLGTTFGAPVASIGDLLNYQAPLSLIASPRGFRYPPAGEQPADQQLRFKRSIESSSSKVKQEDSSDQTSNNNSNNKEPGSAKANQRSGRSLMDRDDQSTAIKTQKTIQVVSPDDVAFSLLADELLSAVDDFGATEQRQPNEGGRRQQQQQAGSKQLAANQRFGQQQVELGQSVCFSASRLILLLFVTLGSLASGIILTFYLVLKQRTMRNNNNNNNNNNNRAKLNGSAAQLFNEAGAGEDDDLEISSHQPRLDSPATLTSTAAWFQHQHQQAACPSGAKQQPGAQLLATMVANEAQESRRSIERQRLAAIEQRHSYLARLYSQFTPTAYWRAS